MGFLCLHCHFENPPGVSACQNCRAPLLKREEFSISTTSTLPEGIESLTKGSTFAGRYIISELLGRGGMGAVFRVFDTKTEEDIAVKLLNPDIGQDVRTINRFRNELKMARKITHKNVCRMYDFSEHKGVPFITMEYVAGENLGTCIKKRGAFSPARTIAIADQICQGLAEAHGLGILHRDIKPQNIMIDSADNVKIMDFGIARSHEMPSTTEVGKVVGTPLYMSPEQFDSSDVDARSDIYSLGTALYEMAVGVPPFSGKNLWDIAIKHKTEKPLSPDSLNPCVGRELSRIIMKCLEADKDSRYQNVEELASDLRECPRRQAELDAMLECATEQEEESIRRPIWVILGAIGIVLAIGASAFLGVKTIQQRSRTRWAEREALPRLIQLAKEKRFSEALGLASEIRQIILENPELQGVWGEISRNITIHTDPPGTEIFRRNLDEGDGSKWISLGISPLDQLSIPAGPSAWRISKEGYRDWERILSVDQATILTYVASKDQWIETPGAVGEVLRVTLRPEGPGSLAAGTFRVLEVDRNRTAVQIDAGEYDGVTPRLTGRIYAGNPGGDISERDYVSDFVVSSPDESQSSAALINPGRQVERGFGVEFDREPRALLTVTADVKGSDIMIGGRSVGTADIKILLLPGDYTISAKGPAGEEKTETISLSPYQEKKVPFRLKPPSPREGTIVLETDPPEAQVFIDGNAEPAGTTPFKSPLPQGPYLIRIVLEGHDDHVLPVEIKPGQSFKERITLRPNQGTLKVSTMPPGGEVSIGDNGVFVLSPVIKYLDPGTYRVRARMKGIEDQVEEIVVEAGREEKKIFDFSKVDTSVTTAKASRYQLAIVTEPEGATVTIDGRVQSRKTPNTFTVLSPVVQLKLEKEGYFPKEERIDLSSGPAPGRFVLTKKGKAFLFVREPRGGWVEIDGVRQKDSLPPDRRFEVYEGPHRVKVISLDGLHFIEHNVTLSPGEELPLIATLQKALSSLRSEYRITAWPSAFLEIDGQPYGGPGKEAIINTNPGPHTIRYMIEDRERMIADIRVHDTMGDRTRKNIHLKWAVVGEADAAEWLKNILGAISAAQSDLFQFITSAPLVIDIDGTRVSDGAIPNGVSVSVPEKQVHGLDVHVKEHPQSQNLRIMVHLLSSKKVYQVDLEITSEPNG